MNSKALFDKLSIINSRKVTRAYSTSFSLGIFLLGEEIRDAIYSIYGFVRFADEIVDTFHDFDKRNYSPVSKEIPIRQLKTKSV